MLNLTTLDGKAEKINREMKISIWNANGLSQTNQEIDHILKRKT